MSETPKKTTTKKTTATAKASSPKTAATAAAPAKPVAKKPAAKPVAKMASEAVSKIALVPKPEPTHEQISRRAYEIWQGRGYTYGNPHHDWWQAEQDLKRA